MLKKGWFWFLLAILTQGLSNFIMGFLLKIYKKNKWYSKWYYWVLAFLLGLLPGIIMIIIFYIYTCVKISNKYNVPGKEVYNLPYVWLFSLTVPFVGWSIFIVMFLYISLAYTFRMNISK